MILPPLSVARAFRVGIARVGISVWVCERFCPRMRLLCARVRSCVRGDGECACVHVDVSVHMRSG